MSKTINIPAPDRVVTQVEKRRAAKANPNVVNMEKRRPNIFARIWASVKSAARWTWAKLVSAKNTVLGAFARAWAFSKRNPHISIPVTTLLVALTVLSVIFGAEVLALIGVYVLFYVVFFTIFAAIGTLFLSMMERAGV